MPQSRTEQVKLSHQVNESLQRGCKWLSGLLDAEGSLNQSLETALYYKIPATLALNGDFNAAFRTLNWIESRFIGDGGKLIIPPEQEARRRFNTYDRSWLAWGASLCGRYDLAFKVSDDIVALQDTVHGGFWDTEAAFKVHEGLQHAMTAGMAGLGLLANRHIEQACRAAQFLIKLLDVQPNFQSGMYLVARCSRDGRFDLLLEKNGSDYVDRQAVKQRPARLGPVQVLLARLFRLTGNKKYLQAAMSYTDLILTGRDGIYDCVEAHKFLWGLMELAPLSLGKQLSAAAERIVAYLIEHQRPNGQWFGDAVGGDGPDQLLDLRLNTTCNALVGLAYYQHWSRT